MKVTTLIENRPCPTNPHLVGEWGLSLHIEHDGHTILFDTGKSGAFADNAGILGVDLASVELAALSHYHYDHGGGLKRFFELNSRAKVWLGEPPAGDPYGKRSWLIKKYIGVDKVMLAENAGRFEVVHQVSEVLPGVFLLPHIGCTHPRPAGNRRLFVRQGARYTPDDFSHEIAMVIRGGGGLVLFSGCSHSGILNMIDAVAEQFPGEPIAAVVGGFHLAAAPKSSMAGSKAEIEGVAQAILDFPVGMAYTGHCTGEEAFAVLKEVMGGRLEELRSGSVIEV